MPDTVTHKMTLLIGYTGNEKDLINILKLYIFNNCNCSKEELVLEPVKEEEK